MAVPARTTVVLDPYLLMTLSDAVSAGALSSCGVARFALCDHLAPGDFRPADLARIRRAAEREAVALMGVAATDLTGLLGLRDVLALSQVASIALARSHSGLLASDCVVLRRMACSALAPGRVLCGLELRQRFSLR